MIRIADNFDAIRDAMESLQRGCVPTDLLYRQVYGGYHYFPVSDKAKEHFRLNYGVNEDGWYPFGQVNPDYWRQAGSWLLQESPASDEGVTKEDSP